MPFLLFGDARVDELVHSNTSFSAAKPAEEKVKLKEKKRAPRRAKHSKTFPQVLRSILSNLEHSEIISWLADGQAGFVIHDKEQFTNEILPRYFKKTKYTSFTRKLNRWGFSRITRGPNAGSFYNKNFHQENESCKELSCKIGGALNTNSTDEIRSLSVSSATTETKVPETKLFTETASQSLSSNILDRSEHPLLQSLAFQKSSLIYSRNLRALNEKAILNALTQALHKDKAMNTSYKIPAITKLSPFATDDLSKYMKPKCSLAA